MIKAKQLQNKEPRLHRIIRIDFNRHRDAIETKA